MCGVVSPSQLPCFQDLLRLIAMSWAQCSILALCQDTLSGNYVLVGPWVILTLRGSDTPGDKCEYISLV